MTRGCNEAIDRNIVLRNNLNGHPNSRGVQMKPRALAVLAVIAVSTAWPLPVTNAQTKLVEGNAEAGRSMALLACTGCHVVAPDQPFKPIRTGLPRPPDFKEIANRSTTTAVSLQHHLETLPAVPENAHMPNLLLSNEELRDVVAFIISLRDKPAAPTQ